MPSPFPGMDPYLEDPDLWPDVHANLIATIQAELNRQIAPNYVARVEQRVFISDENDPSRDRIVPEVRVVRSNYPPVAMAAVATLPVTDEVESIEVVTEIDEEIIEPFVRVYDRRDRTVVGVIEVLSPANKTPGSAGRRAYQAKRQEVMASPAHLVEIDLLRAGARPFVLGVLPPHDYLVHVSRAPAADGQRRRARVWPIPVDRRLPTVPVPLRHGDADAHVDLQRVLAAAYDHARYDLDVDYAGEPATPVTGNVADWVRGTARAAVPT